MPSSNEPSTSVPNLASLNRTFLAAFEANDLGALDNFNDELSQLVNELGQTSPSKSLIPTDQAALELSLFSHNVNIASTAAAKARLELEELTNKFTQQLDLLPLPLAPILPAPSTSNDLTPGDSNSSSISILKNWCLRHMSYLFPSKEEVEVLASQTSMSQNQITLWFRNARTRSGWSKLFAHSDVNKDRERLGAILKKYDSLKSNGSPEKIKSFLARDELLQLLDKAFHYFATKKHSKSLKPDSIRPWVKEVLSNALATLKDKTASALDSSRQKLSSRPSRKRARIQKFTPSPSPMSQSSTPVAGPSSIPSLALESSCSSLSLPTTSTSLSTPSSIPTFDFPPILGSPSSENSEPTNYPPHASCLTITHLHTAPKTTDPDQFADAEED